MRSITVLRKYSESTMWALQENPVELIVSACRRLFHTTGDWFMTIIKRVRVYPKP